ncbi:MAG: serine/threonine protein kinase, partial [Actinomycetia bacterium]|nr:serine/threonine protein kinase [Actinomycetes bacterium]
MSTEGYEYLGELGRGGFSTVYRAHDERHDRMVAIKILNQAGDVDDDTRRRFDRECRAMGKVGNHPHIASIHDSGFDSSKRPFIVMEFYERGALADQLVGGQPLPLANVLKMGVQISSALEVAHQREILHQDVKPENIFISEYHDFALGDFGISAFVNTMRTQQHAFTAAYAAPESMESPQSAGPRADLYSLGGTIYTTLTGSAPFAGSSLAAIMAAVMTKEPPPIVRADVPRSLARLVMQLLSKKPQDRPSSAREVARQLRQIEVDLGLPSTPMKIQQVDTQPVVPTPIAPSYPPQPDDRGARDAREASAPTEDENRTAAVKKVPIIKIEDVRPHV